MHQNLKPENIFITDKGDVKLWGFDLSTQVIGGDPLEPKKYEPMGTPLYTSPQVLCRALYSAKCDVWSAGVMIYKMLTGEALLNPAQVEDVSVCSRQ